MNLGTVRVKADYKRECKDSVCRSGEQITAWVDPALAERVSVAKEAERAAQLSKVEATVCAAN